jgi:hypothetical protein
MDRIIKSVDGSPYDDVIYYNGSVVNNQLQSSMQSLVLASFQDLRSQKIIDKAEDYYMSVVRWSLPLSTVPLMIMQPLNFVPVPPFPSNLPNFDPNLIGFAVGLTIFDSSNNKYVDFNSYVEYVPQNNVPVPSLPQTVSNESYWYIYSYQQLIDMINSAYAACLVNLIAKYPDASGYAPPHFSYDATTNLYTLHAEDQYQAPPVSPFGNDSVNPNPNIRFGSRTTITIWMGLNLWDSVFIPAFLIDFAGPTNLTAADPVTGWAYNKAVRFIIENTGSNSSGGITSMVSEFPVISNSVCFQNIVLTSNTLPIRSESINPNNFNGGPSTSSNNIINIVSDFTYDNYSAAESVTARLGIVYVPSVYRFINLTSSGVLRNVDIQAQFQDNVGLLHPIYLRSNSTFNFKLMFIKKKSIGNLINSGMKISYM